ncbi:hypothetical protein K1T71_007835 [Dendrolimus kikuchii]|uniref:Uncharacterized protein n=1 Tax=Dendrolimus kikuchii TaxID=765133 RepID=A0ACC1CY74_9NEOP|nr:hypothetical protein K1T71_007835 [Dendrolimus kikuchii]
MSKISCKNLVKDYCSNSTFAGIHFIADDTKHWTERLVWLALVILSWCGSVLLMVSAWEAFISNPISFGVDTVYKDWETKLPAVAVCESINQQKIFNVTDGLWTSKHAFDLDDFVKDIVYFRGMSYNLVEKCHQNKNPHPECHKVLNFTFFVELVRSKCPEMIKNCSYNDKPFECCDYFQAIETDMGMCFIMNSIQLKRLLSVRNIENDPLVALTTPEQRACRFHNENDDGIYPYYSYSACSLLCRKRSQIAFCGCNDHLMVATPDSERCNITGLACLHTHSSNLTSLKPPWATRPGLICSCLPSCNETEITVIKDITKKNRASSKTNQKSVVEIVLAYLPTERFKRNVVRSRLDLVVSVGGTAGLFVGASLLSFVELIFYFTVRFISNLYMAKRNQYETNATRNQVFKDFLINVHTRKTNFGVTVPIVYDKLYQRKLINK